MFSAEVFQRVFVLTGRTTEGKQKKAALRSEDMECIRNIQQQSGDDDNQDMIEDNALPERKETCSSESTSSATLQEGYLTQEAKNGGWYACDENLLDEMELEIRENELKGDTKSQLLSTAEEEQQSVVVIDAGKESSLSEVHDDCGLLEMIDLKQLVSSKDWQ
ncbi:hypothetical protein TELCIR_03003 [Teladorsagia circumcincta]|uniref:Uncharacterized protein n=1 Tax=Teladorsagia circumcincta TaxID=45464 RepID=A0A2G9UXH5_TELCI|nr:hypothetical protein TELCIR_03003 [Teladorsagia circumcincta]